LALVILGALAYATSFQGGFVFDDQKYVQDNPNLQHLWPLSESLPKLVGAMRPVVDLSFAINCQLASLDPVSGLDPWSYHLVNLAVHIMAGLTLYGIARRSVLLWGEKRDGPHFPQQQRRGKWASVPLFSPGGIAFAVAALWLLHPIQTESITYVVQRAESMMGLFYLLTIYCTIRVAGTDPSQSQSAIRNSQSAIRWTVAAVLSCSLGMGSKQVMATAPLVALLYDRVFMASSWREVLRRRWPLYVGLASTWGILGVMFWSIPLGDTAGRVEGVSPLAYAASEPGVIVHYLRLAVLPWPLVLDYSWPLAQDWWQVVPPACGLLAMLAVAVWAFLRGHGWLGFCIAAFFLILGPTSSIVPIQDLAFEHRMYLPLAAILAPLIVGLAASARTLALGWHGGRRLSPCSDQPQQDMAANDGRHATPIYPIVYAVLVGVLLVTFGMATAARNLDYTSQVTIWADVVAKRPQNPRAKYNYAKALTVARGTPVELDRYNQLAIDWYTKALQDTTVTPTYGRKALADTHYNLGNCLLRAKRIEDACKEFQLAIVARSDWAIPWDSLGGTHFLMKRMPEAAAVYRKALSLDPNMPETHKNLALTLCELGQYAEALDEYRQAVRLAPNDPDILAGAGLTFLNQGQPQEAVELLRRALQLRRDWPEVQAYLRQAQRQAATAPGSRSN